MRHNLIPLLIALTTLTACGDPEEPDTGNTQIAITSTDDLFDTLARLYAKHACRGHFQCPAIAYRELGRFSDEPSCQAAYDFVEFEEARSIKASAQAGRLTLDAAAAATCLAAGDAALDALPPCALESNKLEVALLPCLGALTGSVPAGQRCYNNAECARGDGLFAYCSADDLPTCYDTSLCVVAEDTDACGVCDRASNVCVEGACIPRGVAGEPCGDYGCAEGLGCRDVTPQGQELQQTACTPYGSLALGERCDSLSARYELCELGLQCAYDQTSQQDRCAMPIVAQRGQPCPSYRAGRCAPGLICTPEEVCDTPRAQGAACRETTQCAPGLACAANDDQTNEGTCQPLKDDGAACLRDDECQPGSRCDYIDATTSRCAPIGPFICTP
jgi:hypothetical protein